VIRGGHAETERSAEKEASKYQEVGMCSCGVAGGEGLVEEEPCDGEEEGAEKVSVNVYFCILVGCEYISRR